MIEPKAYIVTVDMGYGHQRAVHPLIDVAAVPEDWNQDSNQGTHKPIITANNYLGIPSIDRRRWESGRSLYEQISRLKRIPILGSGVFAFMDYLQRIEPFNSKRDLTKPTAQLKQIFRMIQRGWGKHLIDQLNKQPLPLITSFFTIAYFAEEHGYTGPIYCICTDTDVSRVWASLHAATSKIHYLAPTQRVKDRLQMYGVPLENIYLTGFPLPYGPQVEKDFNERVNRLNPETYAAAKYPLTITFAVGGAGAQQDIGVTIFRSLREYIKRGDIVLNLVAGTRHDVYQYFKKKIPVGVNIIYDEEMLEYFSKFNRVLRTSDILWTKPSELSFYSALGLPIIMAPAVGSQEKCNQRWLEDSGAGIQQEDPRRANEWLFTWLKSGRLAHAATQGYTKGLGKGVENISQVVFPQSIL